MNKASSVSCLSASEELKSLHTSVETKETNHTRVAKQNFSFGAEANRRMCQGLFPASLSFCHHLVALALSYSSWRGDLAAREPPSSKLNYVLHTVHIVQIRPGNGKVLNGYLTVGFSACRKGAAVDTRARQAGRRRASKSVLQISTCVGFKLWFGGPRRHSPETRT
jgi:hypothetical protein